VIALESGQEGSLVASSGIDGKKGPALSVLIPTYQRREYVCRAVRSVFAQRYQDWELIVVDDGSTDGTRQALQAAGPRLRYVWQENRGVSAARNAGLRLARGEIVAFLDSDDRWLPDHLETVVAMLERYPEVVLASTCPRSHVAGREPVSKTRVLDALPLLLMDNFLGVPATAVRREHLTIVGGFDERMNVLEDGELWLRLATRGPFALLQRRTITRQHTRGSLGERGRRGHYLLAMEHMGRSGAAQVARLARPDNALLAVRADGKTRYCAALRALVAGDEDAARFGLHDACARLPELSSDPWFVDRRVKSVAVEREERLRCYDAAARLWPDRHCDTGIFLRLQAVFLALRLGRFRQAVTLLRGLPVGSTPGFLARNRFLIAVLVSRRIHGQLYRGDDTGAVSKSVPIPSA
jgi:glycosyl transferase family 2